MLGGIYLEKGGLQGFRASGKRHCSNGSGGTAGSPIVALDAAAGDANERRRPWHESAIESGNHSHRF